VILLPETKWSWEPIIKKIQERVKSHIAHYCIVVVAEGIIVPSIGKVEIADQKSVVDKMGARPEVRLGGVGYLVAEKISDLTGFETRTTVLGHIQRGGSPTCFDRILATKYGSMAAKLACEGNYGKMAALKGTAIVPVEITGEMTVQRTIDISSDQLVWAARTTGVEFGD